MTIKGNILCKEKLNEDHYILHSIYNALLLERRPHAFNHYKLVKRINDIICSVIGIIILSPLMIVIAIVIKFYDGGPAIYKQVRLTQNGKLFEIWKFRSMAVDAERDGIARMSTGDDDDRVTPIGRILRKYWLDELPQLFNILHGDMSIVGPRPERPELANRYYKDLPDFRLRLQVKAGLTGYAQVRGAYDIDPQDKLKYDLSYIHNMSLIMDCYIIFATIGALGRKVLF